MVNSAIRIDPNLSEDQQLRLEREVHEAELALAEDLAHADRHLADARGEAKAAHRMEVIDAERRHREAISKIQLDQLALLLQADVEARGD